MAPGHPGGTQLGGKGLPLGAKALTLPFIAMAQLRHLFLDAAAFLLQRPQAPSRLALGAIERGKLALQGVLALSSLAQIPLHAFEFPPKRLELLALLLVGGLLPLRRPNAESGGNTTGQEDTQHGRA